MNAQFVASCAADQRAHMKRFGAPRPKASGQAPRPATAGKTQLSHVLCRPATASRAAYCGTAFPSRFIWSICNPPLRVSHLARDVVMGQFESKKENRGRLTFCV